MGSLGSAPLPPLSPDDHVLGDGDEPPRLIVYADYEHQTNRNIVYLVDTEQPQSPPIKVMDGELGVFSFGE